MSNYIDGFVFPVSRQHLQEYQAIAQKVADIWQEYGALAYYEYLGEDLELTGTRSFIRLLELKEDEVAIFGWVVFPSKEIRESANQKVPQDPRMKDLVGPLTHPDRMIFDASRMVYGGFESMIQTTKTEH